MEMKKKIKRKSSDKSSKILGTPSTKTTLSL